VLLCWCAGVLVRQVTGWADWLGWAGWLAGWLVYGCGNQERALNTAGVFFDTPPPCPYFPPQGRELLAVPPAPLASRSALATQAEPAAAAQPPAQPSQPARGHLPTRDRRLGPVRRHDWQLRRRPEPLAQLL
jgi:hypothetical protein